MAGLEEALSALEEAVGAAQKRVDSVNKGLKNLATAAKSGQIAQIERELAQLPNLASDAQAAVREIGWSMDVQSHLGTDYTAELTSARGAALTEHVIEWAGGPVKSIKTGFNLFALNGGNRR